MRDLHDLLAPLLELAEQSHDLIGSMAGTFRAGSARHGIPRFVFVGPPAAHEPIRLGLFAGLHGDEPAGCEALVRFLCDLEDNPEEVAGYDLIAYPLCNPTGYADNTRPNSSGRDLNREFWRGSFQPEVRILERELRAHRFDGLITLHADDTCDGVYGYTHGRVLNEALLRPALDAGARHLPRDTRPRIDGFTAAEGIIRECFQGVLTAPPEQTPRPFDVIFETPALAPLPLQVEAAVAALHSILAHYRRFIAYGQYL
ncbi:MAG: M14 family metallocarboxypeptidase [Opitutaceae bacterium]|nr:M14 family metallocarboxypeptidase [Opitutaceae bacterium]